VIVGYSQHYCGSLQLASDKKIYTARYNANIDSTSWLGVINNPDVLGSGCNYVDNGVSLSGKYSSLGLPNFVPYYLKSQLPPYTFTVNCLNATFSAPTVNKNNCVGSSSAVNSFSWNFGDPASGASNTSTTANTTHTFSSAGTYTVTLTLYYACGYDVITQSVKVTGPAISVTKEQTIQSGDSVTLTATASGVLLWNTGATSASITVSPHVTTAYCVMVNDSVGCTNTVCTRVIVIVPIDIPNVFTPDGDNINDVWNIRGLEAYPDARVSIFNRWGQSILPNLLYSKHH
jgi:PKD repeat protein